MKLILKTEKKWDSKDQLVVVPYKVLLHASYARSSILKLMCS